MGHGHVPVESLSDHGISASAIVSNSLALKEDVNGELREFFFFFIYLFFLFYFF